ncbi:MAG: nicotinate (nicotinamide) nucleotide adenylyltransferase [Deltaproteobacteria bacterium]|nr:nicotinate (nicotinamide) nucleotide adenylyltransferase [Deltaproteobacteria bacterium]
MRVALFGGSFNPIHLGHLRAAEEDREAMGLDLIYFVPAASPPHKSPVGLAPAEHRLQMVRLATKGNRYFMVSDVEVRRSGSSFTIDTVRFFRATMRAQPELYLIMGGDQFAELDTWKEAAELTQLCNIIVHTRLAEKQPGAEIAVAMLNHFGYIETENSYMHRSGHTLTFVNTTFFPISATVIRRKLAAGESVRYFVPSDVGDYIERHALY